jgi:hypothetical protein
MRTPTNGWRVPQSGEALIGVGLGGSPYVAYADQADAMLLAHGDDVYLVPRSEVTLTAQPRGGFLAAIVLREMDHR